MKKEITTIERVCEICEEPRLYTCLICMKDYCHDHKEGELEDYRYWYIAGNKIHLHPACVEKPAPAHADFVEALLKFKQLGEEARAFNKKINKQQEAISENITEPWVKSRQDIIYKRFEDGG